MSQNKQYSLGQSAKPATVAPFPKTTWQSRGRMMAVSGSMAAAYGTDVAVVGTDMAAHDSSSSPGDGSIVNLWSTCIQLC